jgi:HEPN domain-containing protein
VICGFILKVEKLKKIMRKEIMELWLQAKADLKTARDNIKLKNFYASTFFAQQAVEKGLIAMWIKKKRKIYPLTHDLLELCKGIKVPFEIRKGCAELSPAYVVARYPTPSLFIQKI